MIVKIEKKFKIYLIIWGICFVIFNIVTFSNPAVINSPTENFCIGYIFILLAFGVQLTCGYIAFKKENLQKIFYNISLLLISYISLLLMFVIGTICLTFYLFPIWLGIIICSIITGVYSIVIITTHFAINEISDIDVEIKTKTFTIKTLTANAQHLIAKSKSYEIKSICEKVYESLRYSDPVNSTALLEISEQIQRQFAVFEDSVNEEDLELIIYNSRELLDLIDKRNKNANC